MKLLRLNPTGLAHIFLPAVVMFLIGVAGIYFVVASNANPAPKKKVRTGTIKVTAVISKCTIEQGDIGRCRYLKSNDSLLVYAGGIDTKSNKKLKCNGQKIPSNKVLGVNFGTARTLKCTPGTYTLQMQTATDYTYEKRAYKMKAITVVAGIKTPVRLGTLAE